MIIILGRVTIAVMKHHDQKQLWEEETYLAYASTSRNLEAGDDAEAMRSAGNWLAPHCTFMFSTYLRLGVEGQGRDVGRVGLFSFGGEEKNGKQ